VKLASAISAFSRGVARFSTNKCISVFVLQIIVHERGYQVDGVGDATPPRRRFCEDNYEKTLERVITGLAVDVMIDGPSKRAGDHL
jgi:hypothetical protein